MGIKGRFRSREVPRKLSSTIKIGSTIIERWDSTTRQWVRRPSTPAYATFTPNRLYQFVEKTSDALHWPGPPYYHGGPFDSIKGVDGGLRLRPMVVPPWIYNPGGGYRYYYAGATCPNWYPSAPFALKTGVNFDSQLPDLSSYGPTAYKMFSPTKPSVDMGTFFGEFRELPKMFRSTARRFKDIWESRGGSRRHFRHKRKSQFSKDKLANDFLEYTFGWVPFITSLIDFHDTMKNLAQKVRRVIDMNGKWEGRGGWVKDELISETLLSSIKSSSGNTFPVLGSVFNSSAVSKVYKRVYRQVWFHGYFRYYIPHVQPRAIWQPEIFKLLLGLNISPSLLWNITPWSWLIDWFGNVGDILENARDAELFNLVSRNAFLMATSDIRFDFDCTRSIAGHTFHNVWSYKYERKQRIPASPYGFNVDFGSLTSCQKAILGALAIQFFS